MRKINKLISQDFDTALGKTDSTTYSDWSWYTIGKIFVTAYDTNYYKGVLKIANVGLSAPLSSEATYTILIMNSQFKIYSDAPINHGQMAARLDDSGEFYTVYFRPDINFLGKRVEITIMEEYGDINRAIYNPVMPQRAIKISSYLNVYNGFMPDNELCVPIHNTASSTIVDGKLIPCFTINFEAAWETNYFGCSAYVNRDASRGAIFDISISRIKSTGNTISCVLRRINYSSIGYAAQNTFWYKIDGESVKIYCKFGFDINSQFLMNVRSIDCGGIVSNVGEAVIDESTAIRIPLEPIT